MTFRRDAYGRRVLVDRDGYIIATEMRVPEADRRTSTDRNRGWGMDPAPWDPNYEQGSSYDDRGATTGAIPQGRFGPDGDISSQPLPDGQYGAGRDRAPSDNFDNPDNQTASIGPNDEPGNDLPQALESPAPKVESDREIGCRNCCPPGLSRSPRLFARRDRRQDGGQCRQGPASL